MTDTNEQNLIQLAEADLDLAIYRIYGRDRFESLLASNRDALVNPTKWDDPFENFFLERTEVMDDASGTTIPLKNLAEDWYGQCWSLNEETDAMWRIYSPDPVKKVGVKVSTTIRRLFENLKHAGSSAPSLQFFVGRITYLSQPDIVKLMQNLTFADIAAGSQGDKFAALLCIKREAFRHECEVRLLFQDVVFSGARRGAGGVFQYALDPHSVFNDVVLDPRLSDVDASALRRNLQTAGCLLPIQQSQLYQTPRFVIPFV
jgi:hypothetical protein